MNKPLERSPVEVLLATYNGEQHLAEQLDSLLAQSFDNFSIIVSDDRSSDSTVEILKRYAAANPGKFRLLPPHSDRLGANRNFARLLNAAEAEFVSFCDQDDVWMPDKLALSVENMKAVIAKSSPSTPILVHTDLTVVDAGLNVIGPSFCRYADINPDRKDLGALLLGNIATGNTLLINRPLYEQARPVPDEALMFDYWLAQVAAALGTISFIDQPLVLYRQHVGNLIGARRAGVASFSERVRRILLSDKTLLVLSSFSRHAALILERYGDVLTPDDRKKVATMANIWERPRLLRFITLIKAGLHKPSIAANIGLAVLVLRNRPPAHVRKFS